MTGPGHSITEHTAEGFAGVTLRCDESEIEASFLPEAAMLCHSLRHRGDELLGQRHGINAYVEDGKTMGIPLLHPWANRVTEESFTVAGRDVRIDTDSPMVSTEQNGLPIHGLNTSMRGWRLETQDADRDRAIVTGQLAFGSKELLDVFPFPHEIRASAELRGPTLTITTEVYATSAAGLPVSFGFHPYFQLPGSAREDWDMSVPLTERLVLDPRGIPTGARQPASVNQGRLEQRTFDDAFLAPAGGAPFKLRGGGRQIQLLFSPEYGFSQLFAPPDDAVVAFEPMTAPTNALVSGGPELTVIEEGATYRARFTLALSDA